MERSQRVAKVRVSIKRKLRARGIYPAHEATIAELVQLTNHVRRNEHETG